MSSSTPSNSEGPNLQEREKIDHFLGEIQKKVETLMNEKSSSEDKAQISRLEALIREKDQEISMLKELTNVKYTTFVKSLEQDLKKFLGRSNSDQTAVNLGPTTLEIRPSSEEICRLEAALRKKDQEISQLKEELSIITGAGGEVFEKKNKKIEKSELKNSNLNKELEEAQVRIKELEEEAEDFNKAMHNFVGRLASDQVTRDTVKRSEEMRQFLEQEERLIEKDEEISRLKAKISGLEADLTDAHEQIGILEFRENEDETAKINMDMVEELREAKKAMEQMITVHKEVETSNKALERSLRKEINKIGASLGQCRAQKADVERKLKEAQEKIEVLKLKPLFQQARDDYDARIVRSGETYGETRRPNRWASTRSPDHSPVRNSCRRTQFRGNEEQANRCGRDVRGADRNRSSPDHFPVRRSGVCPNSRAAARDVRAYDSFDTRRCSDYRREPVRYEDRRYFDPYNLQSPVREEIRHPSRVAPTASGRRAYGSYGQTSEGFRRQGSGFPTSGRGQESSNRRTRPSFLNSGFPPAQKSETLGSTPQSSGFPRAQQSDNQGPSTMAGPSEIVFSSRHFGSAPSESVCAHDGDRAETSDSEEDEW